MYLKLTFSTPSGVEKGFWPEAGWELMPPVLGDLSVPFEVYLPLTRVEPEILAAPSHQNLAIALDRALSYGRWARGAMSLAEIVQDDSVNVALLATSFVIHNLWTPEYIRAAIAEAFLAGWNAP